MAQETVIVPVGLVLDHKTPLVSEVLHKGRSLGYIEEIEGRAAYHVRVGGLTNRTPFTREGALEALVKYHLEGNPVLP